MNHAPIEDEDGRLFVRGVKYDVETGGTDPRFYVYVVLVSLSVSSVAVARARNAVEIVQDFAKDLFSPYVSLHTNVAPLVTSFVILGFLLLVFDRVFWRLPIPIIGTVSGIPCLQGTWEGTLKRFPGDNGRPETNNVKCCITQTWRKINFDFEGPLTEGEARTVGMFVGDSQDVYVRYIYAMRPKTLSRSPGDLDTMPSEGAAMLRLRHQSEGDWWQFWKKKEMRLQGTYHSDKKRRGDIDLERVSWRRPRLGGDPPNPLIGTWKLVSWENRRVVDGQVVSHPLGENLGEDGSGYMTYNRDRYMFVDIRSPYRLEFASGDLLSGTRDGEAQAEEMYLSYCGRYELRGDKVIRHKALSLVLDWGGADQEQEHLVELRRNRLTLSTHPISINGVQQTAHLTWERA